MDQKKIRLMFIYSSSGFGGIVTNLVNIINNLDYNRFDLIVLSLESDNPCQSKTKAELPVQFINLNSKSKLDFFAICRLRKIIKSTNVQLIELSGFKADVYGIFANFLLTSKTVCLLHGWAGVSGKLKIYDLIDKCCVCFADALIVVSRAQIVCHKFLNLFSKKVFVVTNAIDPAIFANIKLENNSDQFVIGTASRLSKEKQINTLITACSKLELSNWQLNIIGDGEERENLEILTRSLGLESKIRFLGYQENIIAQYVKLDCFVSCSVTEGMPNSVLESGALGIPVILSDIAAHTVLVDHGQTGLIFKLAATSELAQHIQTLAKDKLLRAELAKRLQQVVLEEYNIDSRIIRLEYIYQKISCLDQ